MQEFAAQNLVGAVAQQDPVFVAEQTACVDDLLTSMQESVFYADYLPMDQAPRDGTWIEMRFRSWSDPLYQPASKYARSSGRGDAPDIWRFADRGCLRYADEREWQWRPVSDQAVVDRLIAIDAPKTSGTAA